MSAHGGEDLSSTSVLTPAVSTHAVRSGPRAVCSLEQTSGSPAYHARRPQSAASGTARSSWDTIGNESNNESRLGAKARRGSPRAERRALTPSQGQQDKRQGHGVPLGSPDSPSQCSLTGEHRRARRGARGRKRPRASAQFCSSRSQSLGRCQAQCRNGRQARVDRNTWPRSLAHAERGWTVSTPHRLRCSVVAGD